MPGETVTVTPQTGHDVKGDPIAAGSPYDLTPLEIAPGNTARVFTPAGTLETADYTLYFALGTAINDDDDILVRGKKCRARVSIWKSGRTNAR